MVKAQKPCRTKIKTCHTIRELFTHISILPFRRINVYKLYLKYVTISTFYLHRIIKIKMCFIGTFSPNFWINQKAIAILLQITKNMANIFMDYRRSKFLQLSSRNCHLLSEKEAIKNLQKPCYIKSIFLVLISVIEYKEIL